MKQTIQEILNGWANVVRDELGTLPEEIQELSAERLMICDTCPLRVDNTCSPNKSGQVVKTFVYKNKMRNEGETYKGCGCNLAAKTRSVTSLCPLGKW